MGMSIDTKPCHQTPNIGRRKESITQNAAYRHTQRAYAIRPYITTSNTGLYTGRMQYAPTLRRQTHPNTQGICNTPLHYDVRHCAIHRAYAIRPYITTSDTVPYTGRMQYAPTLRRQTLCHTQGVCNTPLHSDVKHWAIHRAYAIRPYITTSNTGLYTGYAPTLRRQTLGHTQGVCNTPLHYDIKHWAYFIFSWHRKTNLFPISWDSFEYILEFGSFRRHCG